MEFCLYAPGGAGTSAAVANAHAQVSLAPAHPKRSASVFVMPTSKSLKPLAAAFRDVGVGGEVVAGNVLDLNRDAIVSPANSFGDMGGGIDKAIDDFHGGEAQRSSAMAAIAEQFLGEPACGYGRWCCDCRVSDFPIVVAAPTMRSPGQRRPARSMPTCPCVLPCWRRAAA